MAMLGLLQKCYIGAALTSSCSFDSRLAAIVMDADDVTCTGASREYSDALAAPITFVRGLKVSKHLQKEKKSQARRVNPAQVAAKRTGSQSKVMEIARGRL